MKIILGSQSHGRKKILEKLGYEPIIMPADIDEKKIRFDNPVRLTLELARAKAERLLTQIRESVLLITADQVVVCNGKILEKPVNEKEAKSFLKNYAVYPAETVTSVFCANTATGAKEEGTDIAKIWFRPIPENIIDLYIKTRDPFLHSGGFDHEHPMLSPYVERIDGEPESITGMPLSLTKKLIETIYQ